MKILLDESLPRKLKYYFGNSHEVWTVWEKGWLGKKNGVLLKLVLEENFQIFVTVDKNLPYQQNLDQLKFSIVILNAVDNTLETLAKLIPKLLEAISKEDLQKIITIS